MKSDPTQIRWRIEGRKERKKIARGRNKEVVNDVLSTLVKMLVLKRGNFSIKKGRS